MINIVVSKKVVVISVKSKAEAFIVLVSGGFRYVS